jgi:glycosyltransferase involved in cell wall biosynthesis
MVLVSFEKPLQLENSGAVRSVSDRLSASGVEWLPLRYHKAPSAMATAYDIAHGVSHSLAAIRREDIGLTHARSYPAALISLALLRLRGVPYVFDIRGLYPEERVESGAWRNTSWIYRLSKRTERALFRHAGAVVTLTRASVAVVTNRVLHAGGSAPVSVIPTCVDLKRFHPRSKEDHGGQELERLVYLGSVGSFYMVPEMLRFGAEFVRQGKDAHVLMLVNGDTNRVRAEARQLAFPPDRLTVANVPYEGVPGRLATCSATIAFIRPTASKIASAATKISESLAMGLPTVVNSGVGDAAELVNRHHIGVEVTPFDYQSFPRHVDHLRRLSRDPDVSRRCRQIAETEFDVERAVADYASIYATVRRRPPISSRRP